MRDGKGSAYEGGVRVPAVVRLPGGRAGAVDETPIITMDLFPTVLGALGVPLPEQLPLDGIDLTPLLRTGQTSAVERDLLWH